MVGVVPVVGGLAAFAYLDSKYFLGDDARKGLGLVKVTRKLNSAKRNDRVSIYNYFRDSVKKRGDAECYACEDQSLSWNEVQIRVNQTANWLLSRGIKSGDTIALFMPNKPAYPIIWLACLAINVLPAFINYNLTDEGLAHCILVAKARLIIYESDYSQPISEVAEHLKQKAPGTEFVRWVDRFSNPSEKVADVAGSSTIDEQTLAAQSSDKVDSKYRRDIDFQSPACLIYTSGTTGLPKAAIVTHGRSATAFNMWTHLNRFNDKTRIYTPMPLYHSTAALLAVGVAWTCGATVIIGRKFSASRFWEDVRQHDANVVQYVGEVLRYLLAVPPSPKDKEHNVKMAYGNGCRPDVWNKFRDRFGVQTIAEFFASSEGNGSLFNYNSNELGAGAVGHEGTLARFARRKKQVLVRVDPLTEEPARDKNGFCQRTNADEPGEMLCQIIEDSPFQNFAGYYGNEAGTNKKILKDVFVKGDKYFRTGDLLYRTKEGYYYFADRLGDTFRWKSENVSTQSVAEALGAVVDEANVYGAQVPNHEGRAGCAAIPSTSQIDLDKIATHVRKALPKYAQPLFIRVVQKVDVNGTSKQVKVQLRNEGIDPEKVQDPLYWLKDGKYVKFGKNEFEAIKAGQVKL
ncbi:hypothetical protein OIV83_005892 [Microbotryomycetes sp. JL201]|nr:hypothetical protein OIV83_005892 [Microbotryomycetes sp. JL201]